MSLLNIKCALSPLNSYCSTEVYAAHFQKTQRHKLFSKTTLLQKASLKSLHSVLAKEGRSLVLTGLCLVTAQQCSLWSRFAPTEFKGVCLKPPEDCATCWQGHY